MSKLISGAVLLAIAFSLLLAAAAVRSQRPGPVVNLLRFVGLAVGAVGALIAIGSTVAVIEAGTVGVRHAFGYVAPISLMPGMRMVPPWSSIERFSTREAQWPSRADQVRRMEGRSSMQMGLTV